MVPAAMSMTMVAVMEHSKVAMEASSLSSTWQQVPQQKRQQIKTVTQEWWKQERMDEKMTAMEVTAKQWLKKRSDATNRRICMRLNSGCSHCRRSLR